MTPVEYHNRVVDALTRRFTKTLSANLDELVIADVDLEVQAQWNPGFPGSPEEPPESKGWEIWSVRIAGTPFDVTDQLDDDQLARIQEQINE